MKNMAMQIVSGNGSWDGFNGSTLVCQCNGHRHSPDCDMTSILDVVGCNEDILALLNYTNYTDPLDLSLPSIVGGL